MSTEILKTDQIPKLSPYRSETHSEDQFRRNSYRIDPLLELELAKIRLAHIEKEIELERLRQKGREYRKQVVAVSEKKSNLFIVESNSEHDKMQINLNGTNPPRTKSTDQDFSSSPSNHYVSHTEASVASLKASNELAKSPAVLSSFAIAKKDIPSDCVLGSNISSSVVNADVSKDASVNLWTSSSTSHDSASCPFTALAKVVTASQTDCKDSKNLEDSAKEVVEDKREETLTLAEVDLVAGEREMPVIRQHCRAHNSDANKQRCNNLGPFHFELNDVHNNGAEKNKESLCRSRKVVRLVYDGRLLINTLSWLQMPAALVDSRTLRMSAINEVGSYVMAAWRNDFQYLAEVLAHRQRHGTRAEYRIRYIWDRVVEWTPVSELRKATQYEIDYVLKFCEEQGTLSTNKIPSKFDLQYSCSSSNDSASGTSQAKRIRTESKSIDRTSDPETHRYRSCPTHVSTSGFSVLEDKKTLLPTLFDEIIEQDGMVCDKSVFQFHEACRRRRELKRKAIEENDTCPYGFDSSVSILSQTYTIRSNQNKRGLNSIRTENYAAESTVASPPVSSNSLCQKSDKIKGNITLCGSNEMCKGTLGVEHNIRADGSFLRVHEFPGNLTRRNILSFIALIFDPGGGIWKHIIKSTRRNPQHGDSLLVNNTGLLRNPRVKAIVREVNYGPDCRVRTIQWKTDTVEIDRDIRNLCLLEEADYLNAAITRSGRGDRFGGSVSYLHN